MVETKCTCWFDGWWGDCCLAHDSAYADGKPKFKADIELFRCVANSGYNTRTNIASVLIAILMLAGVSIFGWLFYKKRR